MQILNNKGDNFCAQKLYKMGENRFILCFFLSKSLLKKNWVCLDSLIYYTTFM